VIPAAGVLDTDGDVIVRDVEAGRRSIHPRGVLLQCVREQVEQDALDLIG